MYSRVGCLQYFPGERDADMIWVFRAASGHVYSTFRFACFGSGLSTSLHSHLKSPLLQELVINRFLDMQKYCRLKPFQELLQLRIHVCACKRGHSHSSPKSNPSFSVSSLHPFFILPPPSIPDSRSLWRALGRLQVLHFSLRAGWEACTQAPLRNVSVRVPGKSGALHEPSGLLSHRDGQMETDRPLHRA